MKQRLLQLIAAVYRRRAASGGGTPVFGFVCGLLVGVLVAALAIPDGGSRTVLSGPEATADTVAAGDGDGGGGDGGAGGPDELTTSDPATTATDDGAAEPTSPGAGPGPAPGDSPPSGSGDPAPRAAPPEDGGQASTAETTSRPAAAQGGATARGVTADRIRIGVAVPDLGALRHLGPEFDNGDPADQWRAMEARWQREGTVPIHGRDFELIYRRFDILSTDSQRSTCVGFVQDDEVFMVVGITYYHVGSECVAREFRTPLLTSDGMTDEVYTRSHPNLFTLGMSNSRAIRNMAHVAHEQGALRNKTIGVYHLNAAVERTLVNNHLKPTLERLGYEVQVTFTTNNALGGPEDALAVQRFRTEGVDLAILFTSKQGFLQQAEAQRYNPDYLESDYEFGTSDTNTARYPPNQYDGVMAVTGRRVGEVQAGMPMDAEQNACVENYERHAGRTLPKEGAEWSYVLMSCDLAKVLKHTLNQAGPNLTNDSFIAGIRTIRDMPLMRYLPATFTATRHHGVDSYRLLNWAGDCQCWMAAGQVRPLPAE